jgi:hypothetical protein
MGDFRVVLEATGGHGCQREKGDGDMIFGCGRMNCPDCIVQEFIEKMAKAGHTISSATLTHWPNAAQWGGQSVVDEYKPSSTKISTYKKTELDVVTNTYLTTDVDVSYVDYTPPHRIRKGYFPDHPSQKELV